MTLALQSRKTAGSGAPASRKASASADPYGLTRVLMDAALERIDAAREQVPQGRGPGVPAQRLLQSATMIIGELRAGLDLHRGGAFAANVDDLYDYMCRRLHSAAEPGKAPGEAVSAALDEVSHLLEALRSAWTLMPAEVRIASLKG